MSPDFSYSDLLPIGADTTKYRLISKEGVSVIKLGDREFLQVEPAALTLLTETAIHDISHYLRTEHLEQLAKILKDPEASANDRFVALDLLKNANIAAGGILPMCQDTGTALIMGKKGQYVLTTSKDEVALSQGVYDAYTKLNLRYSQMAPVTTWEEKNTGNNLPAQIEIYADSDHQDEYNFMFIAKGGGSANKSFLYQETKAVLNPTSFMAWLDEKLRSIGTAACPPYHLAIVIGGTSAEHTVKTAKLASTHYLDNLPTQGDAATGHGFRDLALEEEVFKLTQKLGIGAQFGGKYFCHDVRVVRLPRHGASLPIAIAVSCSADRQAKAKITKDGIFLEQLETEPAHFLPETTDELVLAPGNRAELWVSFTDQPVYLTFDSVPHPAMMTTDVEGQVLATFKPSGPAAEPIAIPAIAYLPPDIRDQPVAAKRTFTLAMPTMAQMMSGDGSGSGMGNMDGMSGMDHGNMGGSGMGG